MTHTVEFTQEGWGGGGWGGERQEQSRPASNSHLEILSGNKPGKRLRWTHTNSSPWTKAMSEGTAREKLPFSV